MDLSTELGDYLTKRCLDIANRLSKRPFTHKWTNPFNTDIICWCPGRPSIQVDEIVDTQTHEAKLLRILVLCNRGCGYYLASFEAFPKKYSKPTPPNDPSDYRTAS